MYMDNIYFLLSGSTSCLCLIVYLLCPSPENTILQETRASFSGQMRAKCACCYWGIQAKTELQNICGIYDRQRDTQMMIDR